MNSLPHCLIASLPRYEGIGSRGFFVRIGVEAVIHDSLRERSARITSWPGSSSTPPSSAS
jgi:hypothetical protein